MMSDLYVTCRRCGGGGSIETSQSEDGRFSYQDQCPECSSYGVVPASPADVLAYVRTLPGVDRRWRCAEHGGDFLEKSPSKYALCLSMLYEDAWNALPEPEPCKPIRVLVVPLSEEEE